ncbi:MAG: tRNA (adenosine(37)-N6)-threonylcarbamoyltransferase complex transferase subunit TsaD [Candidatus Absconditabacteria bacterium]
MLRTFAIETSCDDTSLGIVNFDGNKFLVEKIIAYSQIQDHQKYGGVVPEVASRLHEEKIIELLKHFSKEDLESVDFISVTTNPGLPGSLLVGINTAYFLGEMLNKEVVEVNHINGHIFSLLLDREIREIKLPVSILTASGGHNEIYILTGSGEFLYNGTFFDFSLEKIGRSIDDAAGECFDKVSRMLGGPYPGGAWISQNATRSRGNLAYQFNRIFLKSDEFDFSFSGMKSKVHYLLEKLKKENHILTEQDIYDISYEFQEAVVEVLGKKLLKSTLKYNTKTVGITGGVSCNDRLYDYILELRDNKYKNVDNIIKPMKKLYSTDNSAMIGVAGIINYLGNKKI